jgi:hypothetical protein
VTPTDRIRARTVRNLEVLIRQHLEAMQRDSYGLESNRWKQEVDGLWKQVFEQVGEMSPDPQRSSLEMIRELWTMYLKHYVATAE